MGPSEEKPVKNFGEKRAWAYLGTAKKNLRSPYYMYLERVKLRTSNLAGTLTGSEQKPMKNFGEKGAWT